MADGAEDAIVVGSQNSISTTIAKRRSTRVTKPTAKIQEASDRPVAEDGEATATDANEKGRDGPAKTYLQKILELVVRAQTEIQNLKQIVVAQSGTIQEINQRYETSQNENRRLSEELKHIRDQLEAIQNSPVLNASAQTSPQASYAQVACNPPTSQPSNVRTLTSMNTTPSTFTDTLYCTVDTSHVDNEGRAKVTAGTIRAAIEKEMRATGE